MTIEQALEGSKAFDVANATLSFWVFKKRQGGGFSAKSIDFTPALETEVKLIVAGALEACSEIDDYTFLAQRNEVGCLHVGTDETSFPDLQAIVDLPPEENRCETERDFKNIAGYMFHLRSNGAVLYGVKQVTDAWKTRKSRELVNVIFHANRLELVEDKSFTLSKKLDFAVLGNDVFIYNKGAFESLLNYKVEYANSFAELRVDPVFASCFTDLQPLVDHVGVNTMHLRRIAVIRQKGHYADPDYMDRLRQVNGQEGWNIQFDANGKIIATPDTMKAIMQVLLNHRLHSLLSLSTFDVPSAAAV